LNQTIAAPVPDDRSATERLKAWRQTRVGRLTQYCVEVGVVAGLYYGAARAGLHLAYLHGSVTALWPPVGIGIAALVVLGPGVWPGIVIGDLLVADFSSPWGTVLGQTLGNTLEVVAAAVLFRALADRRTSLERVRDVLALVASAAVGTLISATFGVVSLRLGDVIKADEFGSVFRTWWLADFSGALVFAPLLLICAGRRSWRMPSAKFVEGGLLLAVLIVLIEVPSQPDVPYVVFPILIWAALRFGPLGAATTLVIVSSLTVWNTAHGSGPFVRSSITHSLLATQLFVAVAALTSLVLAAVTAEREASETAQRALTAEQAALRRIATLVAGEAASQRVFEQVTAEAARTVGAAAASLARFDEDDMVAFVGGWSESGTLAFPIGSRMSLEGTGVLAAIRDTGEPQRIDRYEDRAGKVAERFISFGYSCSTAAPVKLGGRVWGALVAAGPARLPTPGRIGAPPR
jgi:integral membrane sensor domain MASE1